MRKKYFWGILFLVGAVAVLADRLGFVKGIGIGKLFLTAVAGAILLKGLKRRKVSGILFGCAFLVILYDEMLHLEAITPWPVLWAALLGTIGVKMLFPELEFSRYRKMIPAIVGSVSEGGRGAVCYRNRFAETVKSPSGILGEVRLKNRFGEMQIYLTEVEPLDGRLDVYVDLVFGETELYVPSYWRVVTDVDVLFGEGPGVGGNPDGIVVLYVKGSVTFGELDIHYV